MPILYVLLGLIGAFNICILSYIGCEFVPWMINGGNTVAQVQQPATPVAQQPAPPTTTPHTDQPPIETSSSSDFPDLSGEWVEEGKTNETTYHAAYIENDYIEIYWVSDADETVSLYWAGTFPQPTKSESGYSVVSTNDSSRTRYSLLASNEDTKSFLYRDGDFSYSTSALGTTTTVHLKKGNWDYSARVNRVSSDTSSSDTSNKDQSAENVQENTGRVVYVSTYSNTVHSISDCSGMKDYREMSKSNADASGFYYCNNCW